MKKVLLTAVCFSVMALGALNVQAADDMPLPPPPPHHGDETVSYTHLTLPTILRV